MKIQIDIFLNGRFYGSLRMTLNTSPFTNRDEDISLEIESRLPYLRGKDYTIAI